MLNHDDNSDEVKKMVLFCVAAASCVLLVFLLILSSFSKNTAEKKVEVEKDKSLENIDDITYGKNNLVSADLDFWDMYDDKKSPSYDDEDDELPSSSTKKTSSSSSSSSRDGEYDPASDDSMNNDDLRNNEDLDDGDHLKVTGQDGRAAYYEIIEDLPKNNYNFGRFLQYENSKLKYANPDEYVKKGIDVSKYQGTIDFTKIKNNDIDFIMVKVAGRGYETGNITIDDKFVEYIQGAQAAGIPAGVYFNSQAVNDVEAIEEANYAVAASLNYPVAYPIAIYLDNAQSSSSRTDKLDNKDRTLIVKKFCETVKSYGKIPLICAPRDYLIAKLNLSELRQYDIWIRDNIGISENLTLDSVTTDTDSGSSSSLSSDSSSSSSSSSSSLSSSSSSSSSGSGRFSSSASSGDVQNGSSGAGNNLRGPDFPYRYSMWQYTENGGAMGINGKVNVDMCFGNYAER